MFESFFASKSGLLESLPEVKGKYIENAKLAKHTWFGVGGPAEVMYIPHDEDDLKFDDKAINSLEYARNSKPKPQKVDTNNDFVEDNKKVETLEKTIQMLENKLEEATQKLQESEVVNEDSAADPIEDAKPKAKKKKKATVVPEEQLSMFDFLVR